MKEEADDGLGQAGADHLGDEQEVVVVDKDDVALLVRLDETIGERLVDRNVVLPVSRLLLADGRVVERRPEDLLAKYVVMTHKRLVLEPDSDAPLLGPKPILDLRPERLGDGVGPVAKSSNPDHLLAIGLDRLEGVLESDVALGVVRQVEGHLSAAGDGRSAASSTGARRAGRCEEWA